MVLLDKHKFGLALPLLAEVTFNQMFACDVAAQKIEGFIYADNGESPTSFYIVHPYGMSLLLGNTENAEFNLQLSTYLLNKDQLREKTEWLQVFPVRWNTKLNDLLGKNLLTRKHKEEGKPYWDHVRVEEQTRVNFKFNPGKFAAFISSHPPRNLEIRRTGEMEFQNMPGTVVPKFFWKNALQFVEQGIGFTLHINNEPASTAFSAYIDTRLLEFGIETAPLFRGKGFAKETCIALINYCLNNGYEPVWACRLENIGSYLLAQQLGFEPVRYLPFYKVNR